MAQTFKVVRFNPGKTPERDEDWYEYDDPRWCVVDMHGNLLDDAQGYGYKSKQNAARAYSYKIKPKWQKEDRKKLDKQIKSWMKENQEFCRDLEDIQFRLIKENYGSKAINTAGIKDLWAEYNLNPPFSARDFLRVWNS